MIFNIHVYTNGNTYRKIWSVCAAFTAVSVFAGPSAVLSAQASNAGTESSQPSAALELPSVTTTIGTSSAEIPSALLPDFSAILPKGGADMPVLPQEQKTAVPSSSESAAPGASFGKSGMFVEGVIGSGFPGCFNGLFSISQPSGAEPFSLRFEHTEKSGSGEHTAAQGFSSSSTRLSGEKRTALSPSMMLDASLSYTSSVVGMQHVSDVFFNMMNQHLYADASWSFLPSKSWTLSAKLAGSFSIQSPGTIGAAEEETLDDSVMYSRLFLSPELQAVYKTGRFSAKTSASYTLNTRKNPLTDVSAVNRGNTAVYGTYTYDFFDIAADAGVVFTSDSVIVPFSLRGSVKLISALSRTPLSASAGGGLRSVTPDLQQLEQKYIYCDADIDALEQSDWFGFLSLDLPINVGGNDLTASAAGNFSSTAYGNGTIVPDYDTFDSATGLFAVKRDDITSFSTKAGVSYTVKLFKVSASWNARWLDRAYGEEIHALSADISYSAPKNRWGTGATFKWEIGSAQYPELSLNGFFALHSALTLQASAEDIICLVTGENRTYAGSYITYGGNVKVSARFKF